MKKLYFLVALISMLASSTMAQVAINTDGSTPNSSAMLDVKSTSRGFLPPRMTAIEMNAIVTPSLGLLVYNTTMNSLFWFNGVTWKQFNEPYTETDPVFSAHPASGITSGNITNWNTAFTNRITAATGTAPLDLSISGNQLSGSINTATSSTNGYLTSTDWNTFNNKQNALVVGSATSSDLTITGGKGAIIGSGMALTVNKGDLTSSDLTITGGTGAVLGSGATLAVNKGNLTETGSSVLTITNGGNAVLGVGSSIQVKQAGTTQSGYLSTTDFNSFNNKSSSQWVTGGQDISYNTGKVGIGTSAPASSAALEVTSTTSGLLLPRMTRIQRNAIASPAEGLMVYCTTCGANGSLSIFTNGSWMTFSPCAIAAPAAGTPVMSQGQIVWNWLAVAGASGYKWNTTADYETAVDMSTAITKTETGTTCGITYNRYVWTYSSCGESVMTMLTATVPAAVPAAPVAAAHVSTKTSIVWNWNTVADAIGYRWNTTDNFATATEMGTSTTRSETGLTCGTGYTRYVWAYNGCGYSLTTTLTMTTVACVVLPTVTTSAITAIALTTATGGGNVTSDGGGNVIERGVCYSTSPNPSISGSKTSDGGGPGVFTSDLSPLLPNTLYYVKAYATNSAGTGYGDQVSFSTIAFAVGQSYGGGIIFYIDGTGQHGLISATSDQSAGAQWGCHGTTFGTPTAIGTGQANTTAIVNGCGEVGDARICNDLSLNGYDDWFLPSKDELNQMYAQKIAIGGFTNSYYPSSSDVIGSYPTSFWGQYFGDGSQNQRWKDNTTPVRAIRAF